MNPWLDLAQRFGPWAVLLGVVIWKGGPWLARYLERQEKRIETLMHDQLLMAKEINGEFLKSMEQSNRNSAEVARQLAGLTSAVKGRAKGKAR